MKPRIVVCGLRDTGYHIFKLLRQQGAQVVGVHDQPLSMDRGSDLIIGDMRSPVTLIAAGIREADTLVLANNNDALNLEILTRARVINPKIRILNRLFNETLGARLDRTLYNHGSMSVSELAAPIFVFAALGNKAIGQLHLFEQTWPIYEEIITENHPWLGLKLSELWENRSRMLIYYLPATGEQDLVSALLSQRLLQKGDRLIIGSQPTVRNNRKSPWRQWLKALVNLRQLQPYFRPVIGVSLALLTTIFLATVTYISTTNNTPFVDALYFSVGMITGAGGQEQVAEKSPESIKIFTAIMMIVGAGVIGICYALINDFILGSHLRQFWAVARVPSRSHYIVCGLGGIGVRIVQQLLRQGYEVVAIERDPNNRFLHTARSLDIPIIIEDASLANTLKAANIDKAQGVLAVTSDDMINVEIALSARSLNSQIPVVVRNHDPQFSLSVQQVFAFENVLCPMEIAAPSFVAAALGGKILGQGMTEDLLWVALGTTLDLHHPFCGKIVKEVAKNSDFVPLYVETKKGPIHGWLLLETLLEPDDILYLTIPAAKLEQLWRDQVPELQS